MEEERAHIRLIGQLEWLADEIEAQRPLMGRISETQLAASPVPGEPSIRGLYDRMLSVERERNLPRVAETLDADPPDVPAPEGLDSVDDVLAELADARRALVSMVSGLDPDAWQAPVPGTGQSLLEFAHGVALADGETLRAVGERLYESDLRLSAGRDMTD